MPQARIPSPVPRLERGGGRREPAVGDGHVFGGQRRAQILLPDVRGELGEDSLRGGFMSHGKGDTGAGGSCDSGGPG
jgi:hypothetical protein